MYVGQMIGNKKVLRYWYQGPFAYVEVECQCGSKRRTVAAVGMLLKGVGRYCKECWRAGRALDKAKQSD